MQLIVIDAQCSPALNPQEEAPALVLQGLAAKLGPTAVKLAQTLRCEGRGAGRSLVAAAAAGRCCLCLLAMLLPRAALTTATAFPPAPHHSPPRPTTASPPHHPAACAPT